MILEAETCSEENRWNYKWSLALDSREKSQILTISRLLHISMVGSVFPWQKGIVQG